MCRPRWKCRDRGASGAGDAASAAKTCTDGTQICTNELATAMQHLEGDGGAPCSPSRSEARLKALKLRQQVGIWHFALVLGSAKIFSICCCHLRVETCFYSELAFCEWKDDFIFCATTSAVCPSTQTAGLVCRQDKRQTGGQRKRGGKRGVTREGGDHCGPFSRVATPFYVARNTIMT